MGLRLRNQNDPRRTLSLSNEAWFSILDLAEVYGWNPMGTVLPEMWYSAGPEPAGYDPERWENTFTNEENARLVLLEDTLNLADALEQAFLEYEPERTRMFLQASPSNLIEPASRLRPGIGAVVAVLDFCRLGAFWIEKNSQRTV